MRTLIMRANEQLSDIDYHCLFLPYLKFVKETGNKNFNKCLLGYAKKDCLKDGLIYLSKIIKF